MITKKFTLLVDDTRYHEMFKFWRSINSLKLDMTTFGSWCGMGVVDIKRHRFKVIYLK